MRVSDSLEVQSLKKLLRQTQLKPMERTEIERQLQELRARNPSRVTSPVAPTLAPSRFLSLRAFDADVSSPPREPVEPDRREENAEQANQLAPAPAIDDTAPSIPAIELSEKEIAKMADEITKIADRIVWLRAYWATNLSKEVDCQAEAWREKLQEMARKLEAVSPEALQRAIGTHTSLLSQPLRDMRKPTIDEDVQTRLMSPSLPNIPTAALASELIFLMREPRKHRPEPRPIGYVADGLQGFL